AWLSVGLAAFYLLLLRIPAAGPLRQSIAVLTRLHLATAIVLLIVAIPVKTHGRWLTIGWLAEGAALLWVAARTRLQLLLVLAVVCLFLGFGTLLATNLPAS